MTTDIAVAVGATSVSDATVHSGQEDQLDEDITRIRAEIHELTRRRKLLSSSLLSSTSTRNILDKHPEDLPPKVLASNKHTAANLHRIALSATSFSFKDPSQPDALPLLGVRIDICARNGKFVKPYYLLLKRLGKDHDRLKIHRHTIPPFIPLKDLEERYLSCLEEEDGQMMNSAASNQELPRLIDELRRELVSWHARTDAIELGREQLGLTKAANVDASQEDTSMNEAHNSLGITSLSATSLEARYIRIEWDDGRVGRLKLSDEGIVERAVVLGDEGRQRRLERILTGGNASIETFVDRLNSAP